MKYLRSKLKRTQLAQFVFTGYICLCTVGSMFVRISISTTNLFGRDINLSTTADTLRDRFYITPFHLCARTVPVSGIRLEASTAFAVTKSCWAERREVGKLSCCRPVITTVHINYYRTPLCFSIHISYVLVRVSSLLWYGSLHVRFKSNSTT